MEQIAPAPDDDEEPKDTDTLDPLLGRGKRLVLIFGIPLVLIEVLRIVNGLTGGAEAFGWWKHVIFPCGSIAILYWMWQGDRWAWWIVGLGSMFSGGLDLLILGLLTVGFLRRFPLGRALAAFAIAGWPLVPMVLTSSFELIARLVFFLSPSVKAFLRHQHELADRTY
jgi:hypothetical protein